MWQLLRYLLGPEAAMLTMGDGRPDNSASDIQALQKAYAQARAQKQAAAQGSLGTPMPPVQAMDDAPQRGVTPAQLPWWVNGQSPAPSQGFPQARPQQTPVAQTPAPQSAPVVPVPQARPASAPQAQPDTSFFMRNAMMMRDPSSGQLIDPQGASQVRGPDLINKMMSYLHNKDTA